MNDSSNTYTVDAPTDSAAARNVIASHVTR
jgi:hypothetical protein